MKTVKLPYSFLNSCIDIQNYPGRPTKGLLIPCPECGRLVVIEMHFSDYSFTDFANDISLDGSRVSDIMWEHNIGIPSDVAKLLDIDEDSFNDLALKKPYYEIVDGTIYFKIRCHNALFNGSGKRLITLDREDDNYRDRGTLEELWRDHDLGRYYSCNQMFKVEFALGPDEMIFPDLIKQLNNLNDELDNFINLTEL